MCHKYAHNKYGVRQYQDLVAYERNSELDEEENELELMRRFNMRSGANNPL